MSETFYIYKIDVVPLDEKLSHFAPVMKIFPVSGEVDKNNEFGFVQDRRGLWRWVHLKTGEYARRPYKRLGACRAAIRKTRGEVLFAPGRGIYRTRRYKRNLAQFRAAVTERDADFFNRFGIEAHDLNRHQPAMQECTEQAAQLQMEI
jgi:hypothetical protein